MSDRLDEGDLDAALERVDLYTGPDGDRIVNALCDCGVYVSSDKMELNLLELVNKVAEHQPTCEAVKTALTQAAMDSIRRSGFVTEGDFLRTLGGDAKAMQDPLVIEMRRILRSSGG